MLQALKIYLLANENIQFLKENIEKHGSIKTKNERKHQNASFNYQIRDENFQNQAEFDFTPKKVVQRR